MVRFLSTILVLPGKSLQLKRFNFEAKPSTLTESVLGYNFLWYQEPGLKEGPSPVFHWTISKIFIRTIMSTGEHLYAPFPVFLGV